MLSLTAGVGVLAEIAMVRTGYRHRPGALPSLAEAVAAVLESSVLVAQISQLDLAEEFNRMSQGAARFLRTWKPTARPGEFSTHERRGDKIHKRLVADHLTGRPLPLPSRPSDIAELNRYLDTLRGVGVRIPADIVVTAGEPLTVAHTWVEGPTIAEAAATDPEDVPPAIHEIVGWVRALNGADARIDTNLANFCLAGQTPTLIDVLPPLIPSRRGTTRNLFEELFDSLCFDTATTLDALVAYATTLLLDSGLAGWSAAGALAPLAEELLGVGPGPGFAARWFRARLLLATRCAAGQAAITDLRSLSAATSVLTFQRLDERARQERVTDVEHQLRALGLVMS